MPERPVEVTGAYEVRHSPVEESHRARGAALVEFAGWLMPLRYGSEVGEHRAVRQVAGVFDLSHMGEIVVRGTGAGEALDHALVGDMSGIPSGRARYTMACAPDGGVLDDLVVYRTEPGAYLVVANAANTGVVATLLAERARGFEAAVSEETAAYTLVAVQGPSALALVQPLAGTALSRLPSYACVATSVLGVPALVARTGYTGEDGFELFVGAAAGTAVFEGLLEAGAPRGVVACGLAARDSLRLEAGMALYGNELTSGLTPYEAGLGRLVRLDKAGDFVGRAALARRREEGSARCLVGLVGGGRSPRHGHRVLGGASGPEVGWVTSGSPSPTLGHPIAMAYVEASRAEPGRCLWVDVRGRPEPVAVSGLPFYRRRREGTAPSDPGAVAASAAKEQDRP